ncbi:hypothetical protein BJV82DRAFT_588460 [Fennellomyces sp. T-0311]|nr:hypothetical protein BJV82DRAFT_588460 [Fennellomyces sp. T-0311]
MRHVKIPTIAFCAVKKPSKPFERTNTQTICPPILYALKQSSTWRASKVTLLIECVVMLQWIPWQLRCCPTLGLHHMSKFRIAFSLLPGALPFSLVEALPLTTKAPRVSHLQGQHRGSKTFSFSIPTASLCSIILTMLRITLFADTAQFKAVRVVDFNSIPLPHESLVGFTQKRMTFTAHSET